MCPLSLLFVPSLRRTRARATAQDEAWNRGADTFSVSLSRLAARVHDYDAPVPYNPPLERESSVDSDTRSARAIHPPFLLRGSYAAVGARARARRSAPRDHGRYAVDPRAAAAAAAARNRVNASPVVLLVHLGRRPRAARDGGPLLLPRRGSVHPRFAEDSGPRLARARHGRTSNGRSYARARYGGAQAVFGYLNDPQPGVVRELYPWTAMCVRNVDVHVSCSSQVDAQLAAFFIDPRAK